jgi:hypothetical protein
MPPEVYVVDFEGGELANDVLTLSGYENYKANDYSLALLPSSDTESSSFYIISPKDIVIARLRDIDDHIQWLVQHEKYEEALILAECEEGKSGASSSKVKSIVEIGQKWLQDLVSQGRFDEAAENVGKIARADVGVWEKWFFCFAEAGQIEKIWSFVPASPRLSAIVYEMILAFWINGDHDVLLRIVREWPFDVYNSRNVIEAVIDALLLNVDSNTLMETLYILYSNSSQYGMQFYFGLRLRLTDDSLFDLVKQHNLYAFIAGAGVPQRAPGERVRLLFEYDEWCVEMEWKKREEDSVVGSTLRDKSPSIWKIRRAGESKGACLLASATDRIPV